MPVSPEQLWAAWTEPEHITKWFTPTPYTTPEAEVDLRPGGIFRTVMRSPEGDIMDNSGCFLEVETPNRLVWTGALGPGFRPNDFSEGGFPFSAELTFEPVDGGTRVHGPGDARQRRRSTPTTRWASSSGWGAALDQLVAYMSAR